MAQRSCHAWVTGRGRSGLPKPAAGAALQPFVTRCQQDNAGFHLCVLLATARKTTILTWPVELCQQHALAR